MSMVVSITDHNLLTVICVYADYHQHLVSRAAASVAAQTLPCTWLAVEDMTRSGPALGRNVAVETAETPFVTFLDADDTLYPEFAESLLSLWQPGQYVYCDWTRGTEVQHLPDHFPARGYQLHLNTCVIPRATFLALGGYQTQMEFEDTEFWFRAMSRGVCGIHCPRALIEYSADGRRSEQARRTVTVEYLKHIYERYAVMAGCKCGGQPGPTMPAGSKLDGDVLVRTLWGGNMVRHGVVSGRTYERTGNGKTIWMDARDALAKPDLYAIVEEPVQAAVPMSVDALKAQIAARIRSGA